MSAARTKSATEEAMLAALVVAREFISTDRNSLADASTAEDGSMHVDDLAALDDYDQALQQIDAAIALGDGGSELAAAGEEPAFPVVVMSSIGTPVGQSLGMSMRDYFAAKAMQAWLVGVDAPKIEACAKSAYEIADAMLAARQGGAA